MNDNQTRDYAAHVQEAKRLLAYSNDYVGTDTELALAVTMQAQAHATLALAIATTAITP